MPTASLKLWQSKRQPDGRCPVYLVFAHRGERAIMALPVLLKPKDWNERTGEVRKSHSLHRQINAKLAEKRQEAEDALTLAVLDEEPKPCHRARNAMRGEDSASFSAFAREIQAGHRTRGGIGTAKALGSAIGKLDDFTGEVTFAEMTPTLVRRFCDYMASELGNKPNTVHKSKGLLSTVWLQAKREGKASGDNPFRAVRIKKEKATKPRLSYSEIQNMERAELPGFTAEVRDWFVFAFYAGGLRFSDVALLERSRIVGDRLAFTQRKTGGQAGVLLVPQARAILDRHNGVGDYCFRVMRTRSKSGEVVFKELGRRNAHANKELKRIAATLGLPPISFHIARHSFADHSRTMGLSIYDISKALGHSDTKVTEGYLASFDQGALDAAMSKLF